MKRQLKADRHYLYWRAFKVVTHQMNGNVLLYSVKKTCINASSNVNLVIEFLFFRGQSWLHFWPNWVIYVYLNSKLAIGMHNFPSQPGHSKVFLMLWKVACPNYWVVTVITQESTHGNLHSIKRTLGHSASCIVVSLRLLRFNLEIKKYVLGFLHQ